MCPCVYPDIQSAAGNTKRGHMPPFRADHVGSLLRPPGLSEARKSKTGDWKELQNRSIREVIKRQEAIGLQAVTDGEFSREWWHLDFLSQLEGVVARENPGPKFGGTEEQPPIPKVTGKLGYSKPVMVQDFAFLKSVTRKTAKFTIPSPSMLHLRAGRAGCSPISRSRAWRSCAPISTAGASSRFLTSAAKRRRATRTSAKQRLPRRRNSLTESSICLGGQRVHSRCGRKRKTLFRHRLMDIGCEQAASNAAGT